ncbi:MAG: energy-coupling factor transporter transmembrane protein EcfT [Treponema sp.]|jgi:biotin transport system permease protein|nr:energy-coupling factor transporter transmembrane protein EcfT [Treponema sp.]
MAGSITKNRRIPFSYQSGATLLHRAPAGLKLLALLVLSITTFSSIPGLLLSAMLTCAASLAARIRPCKLLRGFRSLFILSLFILIFTSFDPGAEGVSLGAISAFGLSLPAVTIPFINAQGFFDGILSGLRIAVSFAAGSLLFAVTTMRELRLSLSKAERAVPGLLRHLRNKAPRGEARASRLPDSASPAAGRVSLAISVMLGFIPRFFELWETMNMACEARSCKRGLRRFMLIIPLIIERMLEMAAETADALEAKGIQ